MESNFKKMNRVKCISPVVTLYNVKRRSSFQGDSEIPVGVSRLGCRPYTGSSAWFYR